MTAGSGSGEDSEGPLSGRASTLRRSLTAGVTAIGGVLAGCSGGDGSDDDGTDPDDDGTGGPVDGSDGEGDGPGGSSGPDGDSQTGATESGDSSFVSTVDGFDGVSFDDGQLLVALKPDAAVDVVTVNTPFGDRLGRKRDSPENGRSVVERGETSAGPFPLEPTESQLSRYDPGTYTAHAYQERQRTPTEDDDATELVEVDRAEFDLVPEVSVAAIESADEDNAATVVVENTGTGPAYPWVTFGGAGNGPRVPTRHYGELVAPGERVSFTKDHIKEYDRAAGNDDICTGETVTKELTLTNFARPVTLYTVEVSLSGEVNESFSSKTCTEVSGEVVDERTLPEKNF